MTKFERLVELCECECMVIVNGHKTNYESLPDHLQYLLDNDVPTVEISNDMIKRILLAGNIFEVIAYPDTPIGSYHTVGATFDEAIQGALDLIEQKETA